MFSKHTTRALLGYVHAGEAQLSFYEPTSHLHHLEARHTLFHLHQLLAQPLGELDERTLVLYLERRWKLIQNTDLQYLHDFTNPANITCIAIAKKLGEFLHKPYLALLMPSLAAIEPAQYTSSSYEDEVNLKEVVLSDCNQRMIHIVDILDNSQEDGVLKHNSLYAGKMRKLSDKEKNKVLSRHDSVKVAYEALQARVNFKLFGDSVGANLNRLIEGLRAGGYQKKGKDFDSGVDANYAIIVFNDYLETLSDETKIILMSAGKFDRYLGGEPVWLTVGMLWKRLARPEEERWAQLRQSSVQDVDQVIPSTPIVPVYRSTIYCVELIADRLAEILEINPGLFELVSYQGDTPENFSRLAEAVTESRQVMTQCLLSVNKHAFHGEHSEISVCVGLLSLLKMDYGFVLTASDIAHIADRYVLAKEREIIAVIHESGSVLIELSKRYYSLKITQALEQMSLAARREFLALTNFQIPRPGPERGGRLFHKPPVEKRSALQADFEPESGDVKRQLFG